MTETTFNHSEDELIAMVQDIVLDAEFKILTESNEQCATTPSGLAILFENWSNQNNQ